MIREMMVSDLNSVMKIEKEAFNDHWKREDFEYEISENEFSTMLVYCENDEVVGMIGYYILFDDVQITTLATLKSHRGKKIASKLMEAMLEDCIKRNCAIVSLEVRKSNVVAQSLYEKYGFIEMNIRKGYYEDGEDALFMMKALGGMYE